jgi:ribosomal protein S27E
MLIWTLKVIGMWLLCTLLAAITLWLCRSQNRGRPQKKAVIQKELWTGGSYYVECPDCDHRQYLNWEVARCRIWCRECGARYELIEEGSDG